MHSLPLSFLVSVNRPTALENAIMRPMCRSPLNSSCSGLLLAGLFAALPTAAAADDQFTVEARDFDGGNARVSLTGQ
jgi:hypothetical protein